LEEVAGHTKGGAKVGKVCSGGGFVSGYVVKVAG
jgi:hypothetical protein